MKVLSGLRKGKNCFLSIDILIFRSFRNSAFLHFERFLIFPFRYFAFCDANGAILWLDRGRPSPFMARPQARVSRNMVQCRIAPIGLYGELTLAQVAV